MHGDVKVSNIRAMVEASGSAHVVIYDFNHSRPLAKENDISVDGSR